VLPSCATLVLREQWFVVSTFISCPYSAAVMLKSAHEVLTALLNSEYHLPGDSIEIRALDGVVQRCIAKEPRDRYGPVTEVANELAPALARCAGIEARNIVMN